MWTGIMWHKPEPRRSKNHCPKCNRHMVLYRSFNIKKCYDCDYEEYWPLKDGRKPMIKATR